jgi:hypothetical protein
MGKTLSKPPVVRRGRRVNEIPYSRKKPCTT